MKAYTYLVTMENERPHIIVKCVWPDCEGAQERMLCPEHQQKYNRLYDDHGTTHPMVEYVVRKALTTMERI